MSSELLVALFGAGGAATLVGTIIQAVKALRAGADKRNASTLEITQKLRDDAIARATTLEARATVLAVTLGRTRTLAQRHGIPWDDLPKLPEENTSQDGGIP